MNSPQERPKGWILKYALVSIPFLVLCGLGGFEQGSLTSEYGIRKDAYSHAKTFCPMRNRDGTSRHSTPVRVDEETEEDVFGNGGSGEEGWNC